MSKSIYIETTIPSAHASGRSDPGSIYRRRITRAWWAQRARAYELVTSEATLEELASGDYPSKEEALKLLEGVPVLEITSEAIAIAELYIRHHVMPAPRSGDPLHLALASLHEVDYILTWNIQHLANPNKVDHITAINRRLGLLTPTIVTPEALWSEDEI